MADTTATFFNIIQRLHFSARPNERRAWEKSNAIRWTAWGGRKYKNGKILFQWIYLQFFLCNCELQMEICNATAVGCDDGGGGGGDGWQSCSNCSASRQTWRKLNHVFYTDAVHFLESHVNAGVGIQNLARNHTSHMSKAWHQRDGDKCKSIQPKRQNQLQTIHVITVPNHRVYSLPVNK